jgi:hypothetical protein
MLDQIRYKVEKEAIDLSIETSSAILKAMNTTLEDVRKYLYTKCICEIEFWPDSCI